MNENRWEAYRAGILNYWYYDEAEFYFSGGRLLLRGSNGSGKSVTMQSLVTVLLDGVKRADRLDSFGSKSRTMDDYLLGEKEISDYDERTGYLYLEYKRKNSSQYITTGIGLHARRGSSKVDFWGFILHNGRRIGKDISLYRLSKNPETGKEQKIPLTRRELENAIGTDGRVTTEQREYMTMVNQHIFGYEDIDKYEELMKLLIQLRSPKLSRDFKPSVIYEILEASLPTLSDEDLRPLAETLENMEKTRLAIEQLKREQGAFSQICQAYTNYNRAVLAERALAAEESKSNLDRLIMEEKEQTAQLAEAVAKAADAKAKQQELTVEEKTLREEQLRLQEHESYKAAEAKKEAETSLQREQAEKERKEESLSQKRLRELSLEEQQKKEEHELGILEKEAHDLLDDLASLAEEADFKAHATFSETLDFASQSAKEHLALWRTERQKHDQKLRQLHKKLLTYEQLEEQARQGDIALGEERKLLDELRHKLKKLQEQLETARQQLVKEFYEWKTTFALVLPLEKSRENRLAASLGELYAGIEWVDIEEQLGEAAGEKQRELDAAIGLTRLHKEETEKNLTSAQEDLQALQETKEAEPELEEIYQKARQELADQGLPFLPFYEATEYRPNLTAEMRERLESALLSAGILNALILPDNQTATALPETMRGSILLAGEPVLLGASLLDYLEPAAGESGLTPQRIADILGSIAVTEDFYTSAPAGLSVNISKGAYSLGPLTGRAAERPAALFIGRQARESYRRQQIEEKKAEISILLTELKELKAQEENLLTVCDDLKKARLSFPSPEIPRKINDDIRSSTQDIHRQEQRLEAMDLKQKETALRLREERGSLVQMRGETPLPFTSSAYEAAEAALAEYGEGWHRLTHIHSDYAHNAELLARHLEEIEYVREEADTLKGELLDKELAIARLKKNIEALARQLAETDASAIEARITACLQRLGQIPGELSQAARALGESEQLQRSLSEQLQTLSRRRTLYSLLYEKWQLLTDKEQERDFPLGDKSLKGLMQDRQKKREDTSLHVLAQRVENAYAQHRDKIAEYRFALKESYDDIGEMPEMAEADREIFTPRWEALRDYAVRQIALTETIGKPLSPYEQLDILKTHLTEQENLLSAQDKKIYQEIILNSIGRTISDKIYGAEDWIRKMNTLMSKSETSSALRFRLEWKPLTGDDDNELDTADLVELLHTDPQLMKEDDLKKLETHFATRIRKAREVSEANEKDADAFEASVREQLDYRRWFRFRLYYDKGEQIKRRELTDKAFFRFSGGEKAMAMYVPLFSAAYSRYQDARADAPRLITLDEAFAGVDEQNMRDMFRLVEQMGFNYIMNSQAIWGDYDVVPELNIYELLRPLNANFVSLLGYHWNGKEKSVIIEEVSHDELP